MRIFCTLRISWIRISDWLPIVFHFGTENWKEQLKKHPVWGRTWGRSLTNAVSATTLALELLISTRTCWLLTHTEIRVFNCDQCIKIFTRKSYLIKHSLSQAQMYEHKEPTFLTMGSPWFDYHQRIWHALCLWVGFLKPKTSYFLLNDAMF